MAQPATELYGRANVIKTVQQCLARPTRSAPRPLPVVMLLGRRGSGKTTLLKKLEYDFEPLVPCARVDLGQNPDAPPGQVAAVLAFQLNRHVRGVGRIPFPRLMLGHMAIRLELDQTSRTAARREVAERLEGGETLVTLTEIVGELGQKFGPAAEAPFRQGAEMAARYLLSAVLPRVGRMMRLRAPLAWHAKFRGTGTPEDALIDLNQWAGGATGADDRRVDETLCAAFLADLRADYYGRHLRHGKRAVNCLALLDNADASAGSGFLELLVERRYRSGESPDPLVVVATLRDRPRPQLEVPAATPAGSDGIGYPAWLEHATGERTRESCWYPVTLTDLSRDDTDHLIRSKVLGSSRRDTRFLYELTLGHPAATRLLADELAVQSRPDGAAFDPRRLLDLPLRGEETSTVADRCLQELLGDADAADPLLTAMITCSATADLRPTACDAVLGGTAGFGATDVRRRFAETMWADPGSDGHDGRLVPHPFLRRLLLRRLAQRDDDAPDGWSATHRALAEHYRAAEDSIPEWYHKLALVDLSGLDHLAAVATWLADGLRELSTQAWCDRLDEITAAPSRLHGTEPPVMFVTHLVGRVRWTEPEHRTAALLMTARWLHRDRLSDPRHTLARVIAVQFDDLARLGRPDSDVFFAESEKYRAIAEEWR